MPTGLATQRIVSLDAQVTDETLGKFMDCTGYPYIVVYVKGSTSGTISSGVVTIEEADWDKEVTPGGPGTDAWSSIQTVNGADVTGGAQKAIHLAVGSYHFVRVRISTAIGGGGTVSAVIIAQSVS